MRDGRAVEVRAATVEDAAAIAEVNAEAGRVGWAAFLPAATLASFDPPDKPWRERLGRGWPVLVALVDEEIVGFVSLGPARAPASDEETGEVSALYTRPRVWGGGVGRALLDRALDELRRRGFREVVLWTEERNERPRRFYAAGGWRLDGATRRRAFLGAPIREVRYRRALAPARARPSAGGPR